MKRFLRSLAAVFAGFLILGLSSCTTITSQQMSYMGEATRTPVVSGVAKHFDFMGVGVNEDQYTKEYQEAVNDAFKNAPQATLKLQSLKTYKQYNYTNQALGFALMSLSGGLYASSNSVNAIIGALMDIAGLVLLGCNNYDFVVIGEPVTQ